MATRFIGMDVHKQYTVVVGVDQMQQVVLASERVLTTALEGWSRTHLTQEDAVVFVNRKGDHLMIEKGTTLVMV